MSIKNIKLVSGRVPTVPPTQVASDRYQFLGLGQAQPNLGTADNGNVLTTNIYGARTWTNVVSLANLTVGNVLANTVTVSTGLFWANGVPFTAYGNTDVTGFLNSYTGNITAGNLNVTGNVSASYILGNGSKLTGMPEGYTNANVDVYLPNYTGNIGSGNVTTTGYFRGNIFADIITPYQTTITSFNSSSAIRLPVGDNSTRPTGVSGYFRYNTVGLAPEYYNGTAWVSVNNTVTGQSFSGDGSNTVYTLDQDASQAGILVSINGTLQQPGVAYTVSGNQITFAEIPLVSDVIDIRFLGALVNTSQLVDDLTVSGNIISGNIVPSANVTYSLGNITNQWRSLWVSSNTIYIGNVPLTVSNGSVLVNGVASYANTNVAAYLTTATITTTGNVSASNITTTGNVSASGIGAFYAANRPAFRVVGNGGAITATANVTSSNFTVDYNQGSYLNTTTGFFRAPVAGLYQVNLLTRANSNTNGVIAQSVIQHNYSGGNQIAIMIEYGTNTSMNHTGGSTIVKMAVGDTLQMRVLVGTISFDGNDNWSVAYIG